MSILNGACRKFFFLVIATSVLALISIVLFALTGVKTKPRPLTISDLPRDVAYVRHKSEEAEAQEAGKIIMLHYGTPKAIQEGGPIFGVMGHRVVSVEYEIPADKIPEKTVGKEFPGYLLDLPELKHMRYDHLHISYHKEGLAHEGTSSGHGTYSLHFMFITHEEELAFGLVCE